MGSFVAILGFLSGLGGWEILLILMVMLIFFGAKKIPELARGLGKGIREFKDATKEIKDEIEEGVKNVDK
jgi:sec-independent protein translocase protein TatA